MYMTIKDISFWKPWKSTIRRNSRSQTPEEMLCYVKQTCEFLDFQEYFAISKHNVAFSFSTFGPRNLF